MPTRETRPGMRAVGQPGAERVELGHGRAGGGGNAQVQGRAVQPVARLEGEARRLVVVRPVAVLDQAQVRVGPEALDHAEDPVPARPGLAVRQVVELRAEPLDREPHRFRRRGGGNAADKMSAPDPHANPSLTWLVMSHFLAFDHK